MASKRKSYTKSRRPDEFEPPQIYASFMKDLLAGTVVATKLVETRDGKGNLVITYDDPNG
jgi:hypothetical protein